MTKTQPPAAAGTVVRSLSGGNPEGRGLFVVDRVNKKTVSAHRIQYAGGVSLLAHGTYEAARLAPIELAFSSLATSDLIQIEGQVYLVSAVEYDNDHTTATLEGWDRTITGRNGDPLTILR